MAAARFAQRHERELLDPAAPVSGLGVAHDLTRVADRLQIAGDDFVERGSFRAGDLDNAVARRRERHLGDDGGNVVRRDGLEQAGGKPDDVSSSPPTLRWRELDSNFPYAGAMNLVFAPFVSRSIVRVRPEAHPTMAMRVTRPTRLANSPKETEHTRPTLVPPAMEAIIVGTSLRKLGLH